MSKNEFEVIVIDNASTDGTKEYLQKLMQRQRNLRVLFLPRNIGPAGARNIGAKVAKGKYLVLLDDDSYFITTTTLKNIWQKFMSLPNEFKILAFNVTGNSEKRIGLGFTFVGAGAAIEKNVLRRIPFDEDFFAYQEEDDLSHKILLSGYKILYTPNIRVNHITQGKDSYRKTFLMTRNWVWIRLKYYPLPLAVISVFANVISSFIKSLRKRDPLIPVLLGTISAIFHAQKCYRRRQPLNKKNINSLIKIMPKNIMLKMALKFARN
jgi:GT2 family glycosyltransferase